MKRMIIMSTVLSIAVIFVIPNSSTGSQMKITAIDADITSITFPIPGEPNSGAISISLDESYTYPVGYMDCAGGNGLIYWPVEINFPLLGTLGHQPIKMTLVGPFILDPNDSSKFYAFDLGYVDDPTLGRILCCNDNKNQKNVDVVIVCSSGGTVQGTFENITQEKFTQVERPWLRSAMNTALAKVMELNPGMPEIPSSVLDDVFAIYDSDPNIEIVTYFPDSGEFRTAHLTGTDTIEFVVVNGITVSEWGLIVMVGAILTAGAIVIIRRRKPVVA